MFDEKLLTHGKALDLGCGDGSVSILLEARGLEVTSVDIGDTFPYVETFTQADIRDYAITPESYDFIHARNVLPFIEKDKVTEIIDRMWKGLKPNGVMYFTVFGEQDAWNGKKDDMVFFTESEADALVKDMTIYDKTVRLGMGRTMKGSLKFCHIISYICVKSASLV